MQFLRRISTARLLALCAAALAVVIGGAAIALAATSGGPVPPKKPLANAVHDAITAPELQGVTARISFKNNLLSGVDLRGSNPILGGADGRLWATNDGHFRLELQSNGGGGDAQIVSDGKSFWIYDGSSNTVYRGSVPQDRHKHAQAHEKAPTIGQIQQHIDKVMQHTTVTGPTPGNIAGQPSYTVKTSPKKNGGLLGALAFAWDAKNGSPLRGAIYAKGSKSPVIELKATHISFGPVDSSVFNVSPPTGAKSQSLGGPHGAKGKSHGKPVIGLANVQKHVNFQVAAPSSLAGRQRSGVQSLGKDGAVATYGNGLDGVAVIEKSGSASSTDNGPLGHAELPTVSINGTSAQELSTPLGTVIRFRRGNVTYVVLGSLSQTAVESAARGL